MAEAFIRDPSLDKLNRLRKDELMEAARRLELGVRPAMRKTEIRRVILEHLVDNDICEESALDDVEEIMMSAAQLELEKTKIMANMELEKARIEQETRLREISLRHAENVGERQAFDVARYVKLIPRFIDEDVDQYFPHFEKTAVNLKWPKQYWAMLLQTTLCGKAQRVYTSLTVEECGNYEVVKAEILKAYELVPEAYRQKFRDYKRGSEETYMEFANQKEGLLQRWCSSKNVGDEFEGLRQLILIEEFLKDLPEELRLFLNEKKAHTVYEVAKMADEYEVTHIDREKEAPTYLAVNGTLPKPSHISSSSSLNGLRPSGEKERVVDHRSPQVQRVWRREPPRCFKCGETGHMIARCPRWREAVTHIPTKAQGMVVGNGSQKTYRPYLSKGTISTTDGKRYRKVDVLRDTGASHSVIQRSMLPDGDRSYTGRSIAIRGVENCVRFAPIHRVRIHSKWKTGVIDVAVTDRLPVNGVSLLLGNDHGSDPWRRNVQEKSDRDEPKEQKIWRRRRRRRRPRKTKRADMRDTVRKEKSNEEVKFDEKEDRYTRDRNMRERRHSPLDTGAKDRREKDLLERKGKERN